MHPCDLSHLSEGTIVEGTRDLSVRSHKVSSSTFRRPRYLLRVVIGVAAVIAGFLIARALTRYGLSQVTSAWQSIGIGRFGCAAAYAALSYLLLTGFDYLGLHYAKHPLSYPRAALASFVSLTIGHNIGMAALSSGAVRYRFYSRWGLNAEEVAKVVAFSGATVGLGLATLGGLALVFVPADAAEFTGLNSGWIVLLGCLCLLVPVAYCLAATFVKRRLNVWKWGFAFPSLRLAFGQLVLGTANFACVAACLHQLMLGVSELAYAKVAAVYVIANVGGLISHVPGGLGVLETTAHYLLQSAGSVPALIAFRLVYFLAPLILGLGMFAASEIAARWGGSTLAENSTQKPTEGPNRS
ncbi:MAG: flippase-like domain-containing protein [Aquamicrobium sp.]|nr:flippase-like domain-containing protein [Aquamicrobium sp.]